jgi:hypothetical protein
MKILSRSLISSLGTYEKQEEEEEVVVMLELYIPLI